MDIWPWQVSILQIDPHAAVSGISKGCKSTQLFYWIDRHAADSGTSREGKSTNLYLLDRPPCR